MDCQKSLMHFLAPETASSLGPELQRAQEVSGQHHQGMRPTQGGSKIELSTTVHCS